MTNSRAGTSEYPNQVVKDTSQTKNSDTTLANDTELLTPSLETGRYFFKIQIMADSDSTADLKYTVAFSGTADNSMGFTTQTQNALATAFATSQSMLSGTWPVGLQIHGMIDISVAGVLSFQWAQQTSDAVDTIILAGSRLSWKKVT